MRLILICLLLFCFRAFPDDQCKSVDDEPVSECRAREACQPKSKGRRFLKAALGGKQAHDDFQMCLNRNIIIQQANFENLERKANRAH